MSSFSIARTFPAGAPRWSWLPVSIALNLILIGAILGWAWRPHTPPPRQALVTWQRVMMPSLAPADSAVVGAATDRIAAAQSSGDIAVHAAYTRIRAILAVSPLDRTGLEAAFETIRATRDAQQASVNGSFLDEMTSLSPEGRAKLLLAMEAESRRWHPPGGH